MRLLIVAALMVLLTASTSPAGSFGFQRIDQFTRWEPSGCYEPRQPITFRPDVNSFNSYVDDVNRYIDCLYREANEDIKDASAAIKEGARDRERAVLNDLERARAQLKSQLQR